jgi:hypothetical protein
MTDDPADLPANETARRAPLPPESAALLPPSGVRLSATVREDRAAARDYWRQLERPGYRARVVRAARVELAAMRRERQAFAENAEWKARNRSDVRRWTAEAAEAAVRRREPWGQQAAARRQEYARRWAAISEERALAIAIAALERAARQPRRHEE